MLTTAMRNRNWGDGQSNILESDRQIYLAKTVCILETQAFLIGFIHGIQKYRSQFRR